MKDLLPENIKLSKLATNGTQSFDLESHCTWLQSLLENLIEQQSLDPDEPNSNRPHQISAQLEITKKNDQHLGDYVTIEGQLKGNFFSSCVRCLKATKQDIDIEINSCFLEQRHSESDQFKDLISFYISGAQRDLYFQEGRYIPIKEMIHEHLYTHIEEFPLHDNKCQGLCPTCGIDLNQESCKHKKNLV